MGCAVSDSWAMDTLSKRHIDLYPCPKPRRQRWASSNDIPMWTVKVTGILCGLSAAVYAAVQVEPSPAMSLFFSFGPLLAVILWLQKNAKQAGVPYILDLGLFLWLAWPIIIPWYAFKTRGRAGWRLSLGLFTVIGSAYLCWMTTAWTIYAVRYASWNLRVGS